MRHPTCVRLAAMVILPAMPVLAQIDPRVDPELTGPSVTRRGAELMNELNTAPAAALPAEAPRFSPARPHWPDTPGGTGRLMPDGSFLVEHAGELRASPSGAWIFIPNAADGDLQIRPMIVLPSQILGRLQRVVGQDDTAAARVRLTGRVTLFHRQNYLLITAIGDQDTTTTEAAQPNADAEPGDNALQPATGDGLSGAVESLINELESERTGVRAVLAGIGAGDESALAPVAEGRTISRRRGRFVRLDAGELAIAFDNDQAEPAIDAPLVVAPCALLESVEATLETHGDAMTATVTGQTLAFGGRSFLLPVSIVIDRPSELNSRQ